MYQPVIIGPDHRWIHSPFDLKFDAKWTHQPGSVVKMWPNENLSVSVEDRQEKGKFNGIRFATGSEWISVASGKTLRVSLTTQAPEVCNFLTAYLPRDSPHSGFYYAISNKQPSTMSFDFYLPEGSKSPTHFILFQPERNNVQIDIIDANIRIL